MMASTNGQKLPGWGWPAVVVIVVHLGLAAIPIHFSQAHSEEPPMVALSMTPLPELEPPPPEQPYELPDMEVEREFEPIVEPEPVVEAVEPQPAPVETAVAVAEEVPEPVVEEPPVVEDIPETQPVERAQPEALALPDLDVLREQRRQSRAESTAEPVDWQGYGRGLMQAVQDQQNYPRMARRMGWEGTATVRITVDRYGDLAGPPRVVDSSNYDALDEEALNMVESAAPFDSFPGAAGEDEREFVIPVRFRLEG